MTGIIKWCYCMWKIDTITNLINMLHNCHYYALEICQNNQDKEMLHKEMKIAQKLTSLYAYYWPPFGIGVVLHYLFNPISFRLYEIYVQKHNSSEVPKLLPLPGWFPWDEHQYYGWSYFFQISGVTGCCMGSICYDQLYVATLIIICSHLTFLSQALQLDFNRKKVKDNNLFEKRLRNCVELHKEVLCFVEKLEIVGSPCMFVQCVQNIVIICLCSFEAATLQIEPGIQCLIQIFNLLEFSICIAVQLLFFCFVASTITKLGLDVSYAVYSSKWVSSYDNLDYKIYNKKKNHLIKYAVLIMSARAQRPISLTGGPFYILSLETFKSIMGIAVSNAVVLSQTYNRKAL
ncbi:odorant receptor Or1-like [Leptopilina boulardi]|uniref:odorant receptor Or1-like n=1 Tax=Leptopilina boulardi TaxID=63433 RepID=UPI0021F500FA|nr:odorant receptor Or1-like [Leptopilina boulardi]